MLLIRRFLAFILSVVCLFGYDFSAAELNFDNANSGYLTPMTEEKGCCVFTTAPVLTGCFRKDDARAYVFVNMFSPDNGKSAKICVNFDEAENITVYRKGNVIRTEGNTLKLTLENNEGIFVTVE